MRRRIQVIFGFLGSSLTLMVLSWGLASIPGLPWRGKVPGVPVKDYISQSTVFSLCAVALLGSAVDAWRHPRQQLAFILAFIAVAFVTKIAFVETSRTTLVTLAVLVPLFGFLESSVVRLQARFGFPRPILRGG